MSEIETATQSSKEKEKAFWNSRLKNVEVFKMITQGKTIEEIEKDLNLRENTIVSVMNNSFFNKRLKNFLNKKLYDVQIAKIAYMPKAFELMKEEFEKRISKVSDDTIFNGFLKLLAAKMGNTTINPTIVNFTLTELREEKERAEGGMSRRDFVSEDEAEILRKEFDIPTLNPSQDSEQSNDNETKRANEDSQMDKGNQSEDEQEGND